MLAKTLLKYFHLFVLFGKISMMNQIASRLTFVVAVIGKIIRSALLVVFFQALFLHVSSFAGWSFPEVLLLIAVYLTVEWAVLVTFHRNLAYWFPKTLLDGSFDFILTKPLSPLFYSSFRIVDWFDIVSVPPIVLLWVYVLSRFPWSLQVQDIVLFVVFLLLAILFYFALLLMIASTAFWTIHATGVGRFLENIFRAARYPTSSFRGVFRIVFLFVIPLGFVATLPVEVLLARSSWYSMSYMIVFVAFLLFLAIRFWRFALKHYSSASS